MVFPLFFVCESGDQNFKPFPSTFDSSSYGFTHRNFYTFQQQIKFLKKMPKLKINLPFLISHYNFVLVLTVIFILVLEKCRIFSERQEKLIGMTRTDFTQNKRDCFFVFISITVKFKVFQRIEIKTNG